MTLAAKLNFKWNRYVKTDLRKLIPNANSDGIALIESMLYWEPKKRPTANQVLKHPYFKGMQEATTVNTIPSANTLAVQAVENYDDINELLKASEAPIIKQSSQNNNMNMNNNSKANQVHLQSLLPDNTKLTVKKQVVYKDSIDDIDDMLLDFEKKYSNNSSTNNSNVNVKNSAPKIANSSTSIYPVVKTPQQKAIYNNNNNNNNNANNNTNATNNNIRDSILAQFKEDPIFSDLLYTNTHMNSKTNTLPQNNNTNNATGTTTNHLHCINVYCVIQYCSLI